MKGAINKKLGKQNRTTWLHTVAGVTVTKNDDFMPEKGLTDSKKSGHYDRI